MKITKVCQSDIVNFNEASNKVLNTRLKIIAFIYIIKLHLKKKKEKMLRNIYIRVYKRMTKFMKTFDN